MILYDETAVEIPDEFAPRARPVRMEKLAKEIGGSLRAKNMVAVGAVSGVISFDTTPIEELVLRRYAHKQGVADANIAALRAGGDESGDLKGSLEITKALEVESDRILLSGNQAIAAGAMAAGLEFFAGYPITPASDILEWLSAKLPAGRRHHDPVRGRDRLDLGRPRRLLRRRQGDDGDLGPRPLPHDRDARLLGHGRDPLRRDRRPARRPLHRPADQDRAVAT